MIGNMYSGVFTHIQSALPTAISYVNVAYTTGADIIAPDKYVLGWAEPFDIGGVGQISVNLDRVAVTSSTMAQVRWEADLVLVWTINQAPFGEVQSRAVDALIKMWVSGPSFGGACDMSDEPEIAISPPATSGKDMGLIVATWKIKKGGHYG